VSTPEENYYSMNPADATASDSKSIGYGLGGHSRGQGSRSEQGPPVPAKQPSVDTAYLEHPSKAYTDDPGPTPQVPEKRFYPPPSSPPPPPSYDMQEPPQAMAHPAEGILGRKTPRQNTYASTTQQQQKPYDPYIPR
jgi:hypothetical protein